MKRLLSLLVAILCLTAPLAVAEESTTDAIDVFASTKLDLTPYRGKAIYINLFTKWCGYCMMEMPDIKKTFDSYDPEELQIILVHVWDGETEAETAEVREAYGMENMTFFEDKEGEIASFLGIGGYPYSLFINSDGSVYGYLNGAMTYENMQQVLGDMGLAPVAAEDGEPAEAPVK